MRSFIESALAARKNSEKKQSSQDAQQNETQQQNNEMPQQAPAENPNPFQENSSTNTNNNDFQQEVQAPAQQPMGGMDQQQQVQQQANNMQQEQQNNFNPQPQAQPQQPQQPVQQPQNNMQQQRPQQQDMGFSQPARQQPMGGMDQQQQVQQQANNMHQEQQNNFNPQPQAQPQQPQQPVQQPQNNMQQQRPQPQDIGFSQPARQQPQNTSRDSSIIGADDVDPFNDVDDARITVIGAGGMGNNAITRLQNMGINGADTLAINTDKQHLLITNADKKILIGKEVTRGLGAGGYPAKGKDAAEESMNDLEKNVKDTDLVFMISGMGGGTGTGSAPVMAKLAKKNGAIVIGVVTMPFKIEGGRIGKAEEGLAKLRQQCDTVIVIENDKLLEVAGEMPLQQAFAVADEIITTMIKGITETISTPSIVNLDFADVKSVMKNGGVAVIGIGESSTAARSREAVEEAMSNPLLDVDYRGATGALVHIAGGPDMKLTEIGEIGQFVSKHLDPDASTIWGARIDKEMQGQIRVITIITGIKSQYVLGPKQPESDNQNIGESLGIKMV